MAKKILLADDSVTIQKVVELTFMDLDYELVATSDGRSALEQLQEVGPDLVIADVHMPQTDGYEVCRQTKSNHPGIPVLLLVGTFEQFDEAKAAEVGADGHLKKPFDSQDLLNQVENLIATSAGPAAVSEAPALEAPAPEAPLPSEQPVFAELEPPTLDELGSSATAGADTRPTAARPAADPPEADFEIPADDPPFEVEETSAAESAAPADVFETTPGDFDLASLGSLGGEPAASTPAPAEPDEPAVTEIAPESVPAIETSVPEVSPAFGADLEAPSLGPASATEEMAPEVVAADSEPASSVESPAVAVAEPEPVAPSVDSAVVTSEAPAEVAPVDSSSEDGSSAAAGNGSRSLDDDEIERIAKRVAEIMGEKALREVAWEVVPDLAEVIIKERIRELESQVE
ncbi:MAG: response regulator [Acidobacteriota bacterium]